MYPSLDVKNRKNKRRKEHPETKHALKVAPKTDRYKLCALFEQDKQLGNIAIALFADAGETDPAKIEGEASYEKAFVFMKELAEHYIKGNCDASTILEFRHEMMRKRNIPLRVPIHLSKLVKKNTVLPGNKPKDEASATSDTVRTTQPLYKKPACSTKQAVATKPAAEKTEKAKKTEEDRESEEGGESEEDGESEEIELVV
jgi:hypothetical protein